MINNKKKSKKSTTKKRSFKISPLIPIIAIIEVIILVVISSYAWFFIQASKVIGSGTISVAADSGLDIDFQYSNVDDYINIWNYVGQDFKFEPATSLDGRNIYFPTSGTFNSTTTKDIVFRDGTVNDINSKYLSIDFELTNTSDADQYVYLNNNSYFRVTDNGVLAESRALRLAFYQNDGNSGNVGSDMLRRSSGSSSDGGNSSSDSADASASAFTVYFDNSSSNWSNVYAYFWDSDDGTSPEYQTKWPGVQMSRINGKIYSITIDNPTTSNGLKYNKLKFNNNDGTETSAIDLISDYNGDKFNKNGHVGDYTEHTIYFLKPSTWTRDADNDKIADVYCHAFSSPGGTAYTTWPGDKMTYVGSGIYSYSYESSNTRAVCFNNGLQYNTNQTEDINFNYLTGSTGNDQLIYCTGTTDSNGKYSAYSYSGGYSAMTYRTIYLFNSHSWSKPYATVSVSDSNDGVAKTDIALTSLSGNVYYCTVPSIFSYVYFREKDATANNKKTQRMAIENQKVYRPTDVNNNGYECYTFIYSNYIKEEGYPVISPGVSAGFQRPYSPVITINAWSGLAEDVVPAYSNSIDNYILGSGTPLFILKSGHMASLSMIMWLEGTDDAAKGDLYPGNSIDLKLEFSTLYYPGNNVEAEAQIVNPGDSASYIYNFYDKTREIWTSDRQSTESGVTVAPVMQLYDNTIKRGYLMSPSAYSSYDGKRKVSCWTVEAPQSIAKYGHDIIFRRVNPYDEDEVWNYWHAGPVAGSGTTTNGVFNTYTSPQPIYDIAKSTTRVSDDTISFTAFADGSPTEENLTAALRNNDPDITDAEIDVALHGDATHTGANVPTLSCGGLWGNHSVRMVTLLDGLSGQPLKDDDGIITVNYSFDYKVSGSNVRSVTIEYKASGPNYNSLYFIIMPSIAYTNSITCSFKNYINFDSGYAINSDRNDEITFEGIYGEDSTVSGDYFELSKKSNGEDFSFWGSDLLIVQTSSETKDYFVTGSDKDRLLQVHFYKNSTSSGTGAYTSGDWYSFLYYNSEFKSSDGTGFATVIPNDKRYYKYSVESCTYDGSDIRHISKLQDLTYITETVRDSVSGSVTMTINHLNGKNICKLDNVFAWIYLQTNYKDSGQDPQVYNFSASNGEAWNFASRKTMSAVGWVDGTDMYMYRYQLRISKYEKAIFYFPNKSAQSNEISVSVSDAKSGQVYQCNSYKDNKPYVWNLSTTYASETYRDDTYVDLYSESAWPHYTSQGS